MGNYWRDTVFAPVGHPDGGSARELEQRRRYQALEGGLRDLVIGEIRKRHNALSGKWYDGSGLEEHLDASVDIYGYVIGLLADAYRVPPTRGWSDDQDAATWTYIQSPHWDLALDEALRVAVAACVAFVIPRFSEQSGQVELEVIPPHLVPAGGVDWETPARVSRLRYRTAGGAYAEVDSTSWRTVAEDGLAVVETWDHDLGECPAVVLRTTWPSTDPWTWRRRTDLLDAAIQIGVWNTYISRIAAYQSHLQLVERPLAGGDQISVSLGDAETHTGPDGILRGNYDVLSLQADMDRFSSSVEGRIRRVAANHGLSAEMISGGSYRSAEERLVAHANLAEHRDALLKLVKPVDLKLMELAAGVWGTTFESLPWIDYAEPQPVWGPQQQTALSEARQRMGVESPVDEMMRLNRDASTRTEALDLIRRNLEEQRVVQEHRRSFQIVDIDNSDDTGQENTDVRKRPTEPTERDPESNPNPNPGR